MIPQLLNALFISLRPLFGPPGCCRFALSCTQFAAMELADKSLFKALWSIAKRVLQCNFFNKEPRRKKFFDGKSIQNTLQF